MPHLVLEATPGVAALLDWEATLAAIHAALAEGGFAAEETIKSRVHVAAYARSGQDAGGEQLFGRLLMTRPRPPEMQAAMARRVHDILCAAIERGAPAPWVQCCVLHEMAAPGSYLLRQRNPPVAAPARNPSPPPPPPPGETPMRDNPALFAVADIIDVFARKAQRNAPEFFELAAQLPAVGRADTPIAATPNMTVLLKCYASGGENALHAHSHEDHTFVVLQGEATFYGPKGEEKVVGPFGGVLLPHGSLYRFISTGQETLVMLRVGCAVAPGLDVYARVGADGRPMAGDSAENKQDKLQLTEDWYRPAALPA